MGDENKKPYILYVAEEIYLEIFKIKKQNIDISNIDAIERFLNRLPQQHKVCRVFYFLLP